jgi:hypothetical protein
MVRISHEDADVRLAPTQEHTAQEAPLSGVSGSRTSRASPVDVDTPAEALKPTPVQPDVIAPTPPPVEPAGEATTALRAAASELAERVVRVLWPPGDHPTLQVPTHALCPPSPGVWTAATSKADPRRQQDWILKCPQGG